MKIERRTFLAQSLITLGVGVTAASASSLEYDYKGEDICVAQPSPADALNAYILLIPQIQNEVISEFVKDLINLNRKCGEILKDLKEKVLLLEKEVTKSDKTKIQSIKKLINVGEEQVKFINSSAENSGANVLAFAVINDQLQTNAGDLLPKGENTLSSRASELVNEIVRAIKESAQTQKEIEEEQKNVSEKLKLLNGNIKEIYAFVKNAAKSIDVANYSKSSEAEKYKAKADAERYLRSLIKIVEEKLKPEVINKETALDMTETLIFALRGIEGWIMKSESNNLSKNKSDIKKVNFNKKASLNTPKTPENLISKLTEEICGRTSLLNDAVLITDYVRVTEGLINHPFYPVVGIPNTKEAIENKLLRFFKYGKGLFSSRSVCEPDSKSKELASRLAQAIQSYN